MNLAERRSQHLALVPALGHQLVQVPRAGRGLAQHGQGLGVQTPQDLVVCKLTVRSEAPKVEDLPKADTK